ncbi:tetratricopeptide repeat protein [Chryseolinea soli]|uniref:histidine kinase n=1 Tax=Chryseolinea soli TaxID=2321403 RepID=A0A385SZF6_9BACT|nr:tetratricopeptide repeat protein [Chryseolinea soli]AYB35190.1 response regulator [Chryseolinea soli]
MCNFERPGSFGSTRNWQNTKAFVLAAYLFIFCWKISYGQQTAHRVDSLERAFEQATAITDKIKIAHRLADISDPIAAIGYSERALKLAEQTRDGQAIMESLIHLGSLHTRTSRYPEARAILNKAIRIGIAKDLSSHLSEAYLELSIAYVRQQELDSARATLNKSLSLVRKKEDEVNTGFVYNMLGNVAKEENNFEAASQHYIRATEIFEKYHNDDGLTQSLSNIGNIQYLLGNYDKAETYALRCADIAKKLNKASSIAYANRLLGRIYRKQKRFDEALKNYNASLDVYQRSGERREMGETNTNIGNIYFELEKFTDALDYYSRALRIKRSIPDSVGMAYDFNASAQAFFQLGKPDKAVLYFDSAMFFAQKKRLLSLVMDGYKGKSEIYSQEKQYRLAHENYVRYTELNDSLETLRNETAAKELEAKYESEKKQGEINALHAENEIKTLQLEQQRSRWIYLAGVALLSLLLIVVLYNRYRIKQRSAEKLKQLDAAKSRFFANISHEFRTPLTLIISPLQNCLSQPHAGLGTDDIRMMHRHATRLHMLINQMLDLSRIESGKMRLQVEEKDIHHTVRTLCSVFQSQADQRGMDYQVIVSDEVGSGFIDVDKLEKIVYNLVSNAFKFTPDGGRIVVEATRQESAIALRVRDNGIGIPAHHIPFIFDRFYRVDDSQTRSTEGTGIGLALAKELAEVHRGTLQLTSEEGSGSTFVLTLPVDRHAYGSDDCLQTRDEKTILNTFSFAMTNPEESTLAEASIEDELPLILIAEDNADMRSFIGNVLKPDYRIMEAQDGLLAWEKAQEFIPDLVVTDVMMPRMDGTTFCEKLKETLATSHIPVVMLTAKAGQPSKLDGLRRGADDYLVKPFDVQELQIRVHNLIEQRRKLRKLYRTPEHTTPPEVVTANSVDAAFLQKIGAILEHKFSDAGFGVEEFNREIGLSRMQLHRKLKAITDQSTGEFIRNFRLEKARQYLVVKDAQVSQVAYDCGFSNVSHFSKTFKDHTGMTPSEFVANAVSAQTR